LTQAVAHRPAAAVGLFLFGRLHAFECGQQQLQRVVVGCRLVEDDVATQREVLGLDARERKNLAGVHDGRVEPDLHALVQEHAVQHLPRSGVDAEAHVRKPHHRERTRDLCLDTPNRFDALDAVAAQVGVAGGEREGEGVEDEVARREAIALGGDLVQAVGDLHLPLHIAGLATFVDQETNDGGAIIARQGEHAVHAVAGFFAVFEVCAVQDATATSEL